MVTRKTADSNPGLDAAQSQVPNPRFRLEQAEVPGVPGRNTGYGSTLSERAFQTAVLRLLELLGYRAVHHRPLRTRHAWATGLEGAGSKGWPDILAIRTRPDATGGRHRIIAIELKSRRGRVEPDQVVWLKLLAAAGVEVHVWRAGTDTLQTIADVLR